MRVSVRVPEMSLLVVLVASLLTGNSALATASTNTYYLNGPIVRVNSDSLQGVSLAAGPGVAFTSFQGIGDTVFFSGNSTAAYQTDNTTNTTINVWLCTDINEAGPSWGVFNFSWSIVDNSPSYPAGFIVVSSNFTANLTADWTQVFDSAPTKITVINSTDTVQLAIQCTSTSISPEFAPGWWLSSNSSLGTDTSSVNIPLKTYGIPEMQFYTIAAALITITVLVTYRGGQKLKRYRNISA